WQIANDCRGSVDGWDFKNYVLGLLFYRFISENIQTFIDSFDNDFDDYKDLTDEDLKKYEGIKEECINSKGFFIKPSELFCNVVKNANRDENLNITIETALKNIEGSSQGTPSEADFKGLFDDIDLNSNKLGTSTKQRNEKLAKMLNAIGDLDFGTNGDYNDHEIDVFGDAYEFLMTMYASNAGKSGGEFFTPQEVSKLLAKLTLVDRNEPDNFKKKVRKVYDPACGSGSLLLKFAKVLGEDNVREGFFGQEINITTYNLARMNMFLHNINYDNFDIQLGDTLLNPKHMDEQPFEAIVSNPPYSIKWAGKSNPILINDVRYSPAGVLAPESRADLAFTMHMLHHLATDGACAIVEFPGVLYRGDAEQQIRQYLVENNFVDCIIQLPQNLFFGVSIATCIIVLRKNKDNESTGKTIFIDASDLFIHQGNKNKLSKENIDTILKAYIERKEVPNFVKIATIEEIKEKDFNLSVSTYVEKKDTREKVDIVTLNKEIDECVEKITYYRAEIKKIVEGLEV
ncbi:MAG: type I restriction-modification system subunit M, partial [Rickettsiales bacterium]|nr:type I restriction-modification system subunit M [Rickettsiales bacterium]